MSLDHRYILPRPFHRRRHQAELAPLRSSLIEAAEGRVLEVGIGSGVNIPYYGRDVVQLIGIDSSRTLLTRARKTAVWSRCPVRLLQGRSDALPLADRSIDHAVMTWTLCSLPDPLGTLIEIHRVLRPEGALSFIEHGQAPDSEPRTQLWQRRITPFWRRFAGNCHPDRRIDQLLRAAGFKTDHLECGYLVKGPKMLTFHYRGRAVIEQA